MSLPPEMPAEASVERRGIGHDIERFLVSRKLAKEVNQIADLFAAEGVGEWHSIYEGGQPLSGTKITALTGRYRQASDSGALEEYQDHFDLEIGLDLESGYRKINIALDTDFWFENRGKFRFKRITDVTEATDETKQVGKSLTLAEEVEVLKQTKKALGKINNQQNKLEKQFTEVVKFYGEEVASGEFQVYLTRNLLVQINRTEDPENNLVIYETSKLVNGDTAFYFSKQGNQLKITSVDKHGGEKISKGLEKIKELLAAGQEMDIYFRVKNPGYLL